MNLQILPLALTMMAGPQIMSAIILVTTPRAVRVSLAFLLGVLCATTGGVVVARGLAALLGSAVSLQGDQGSTLGKIIQIVLILLLALLALRSYLTRATSEPPKWLGELMTASPARALKTGLLIILAMPSDIVVMLTVGVNLEQNNDNVLAAIPFIAATVLVAALPLLAFLVFHRRAKTKMPAVRDWINAHSWLINILACLIFIVIIATS